MCIVIQEIRSHYNSLWENNRSVETVFLHSCGRSFVLYNLPDHHWKPCSLFHVSSFFFESDDIFYQENAPCTICKEMVSDDPSLKMLKTNNRPSHCSRKDLTPPAMLCLDKSQIRTKMGKCCHIRVGATQSSLSRLDHVQKRLRGLVNDELFSTLPSLSPQTKCC